MKIPAFRSNKSRLKWLAGLCDNELSRAEGSHSDEVQSNRQMAMDYYFAKPRGDELEGRSQVVSTDVADMTNATLAMLVPMLSTDCVVEFEPQGEDDEAQAKAESDIVNAIIVEDNNGFIEIQEAVKDALLLKNGCMKIHIDESVDTVRYNVKGVDKEQVAFLAQPQAQNEQRVVKNGTLTVTTTNREFVTSAIPIENISYQSSYVGHLKDIRFWAERIPYTRSDLVDMGVDAELVDKLNNKTDSDNGTSRARNQTTGETYDAETRDQDIIDCHECYLRVDLDGDGVSERYKVLISGTNGLMFEAADLLPYSIGSPFLNPHRITGESLFDHLKSTQDVKTAYNRQLIDNVSIINNGRYAYDPGQVAEEDVLQVTAGGGIRARNPAASIIPIMVPDVTMGILAAISYEDQRRTERGGASLDMMGAQEQLVGETAHGIERQYASREAMASMMSTNLSETLIRGIYVLTHEFLRRYANEPIKVRINGKYQEVDPRQWPQRNRVNVKTGMTPGQRGHLQSTLAQHIGFQAQAMTQGMAGILASPETIYRTSMDWLRMAGVDNPERHAIDPQSEPAQEAQQAQREQAKQQAEAQQQLFERQFGLEEQKVKVDVKKHEADIGHKYYDTDMDAAVAEAKIAGQGVIDLEKQRITHERTEPAGVEAGAKRSGGSD